MAKLWKDYESIARQVIAALRAHLGVDSVEGEQVLEGASGTSWKIEGKALAREGILVIECRRYPTRAVNQEAVGGLAFRVHDLGALGAIIVTPLPLQAGAKLVAQSEGIDHLQLTEWSTAVDYLAKFMGRNFHGVSTQAGAVVADHTEAEVIRKPPIPKDE